jgi:hypothetical protein
MLLKEPTGRGDVCDGRGSSRGAGGDGEGGGDGGEGTPVPYSLPV